MTKRKKKAKKAAKFRSAKTGHYESKKAAKRWPTRSVKESR